jgi:hypothetical protein
VHFELCTWRSVSANADCATCDGVSCIQVVVASTDFDGKQSERATIAAIDSTGTVLQLDRPLMYMHWGQNTSTGIAGRVLTQVRMVNGSTP